MESQEHIIETETALAWLQGDIIYYIFKKSNIELVEAKESVETMMIIADGKPYGFFIDISKIKNISKEARQYLSVPRSPEKNIATATLAPNIISKLIGNFYVAFNNPGIRIKLFTDEADAIKWLKKEISGFH